MIFKKNGIKLFVLCLLIPGLMLSCLAAPLPTLLPTFAPPVSSSPPTADISTPATPEIPSSPEPADPTVPISPKALSVWESLAATPPMGWDSYNHFGVNINEKIIRDTADAMVSSGMLAVGYEYIIIDDGWMAPTRDPNGDLQADPQKFPSGMKVLADYIHSKGLKFGLYLDRGKTTCAHFPGSYGHELDDARQLADWGVDYIKEDNCDPVGKLLDDFSAMRIAIESTGRPIVFSISSWAFPGAAIPKQHIAHLWRTTSDIKDTFDKIVNIADVNNRYAAFAGPGHWNDPDMLEVGYGVTTSVEDRTHFSLWAIMAAPLIAGNDLRNMNQATQSILTAPEVIAVDQDSLGSQGTRIDSLTRPNGLEVWSKVLAGTDTRAVLFLNRSEQSADISVQWNDIGLPAGPAMVRDLWQRVDRGVYNDGYTAHVPPHGAVLVKIVAGSTAATPAQ